MKYKQSFCVFLCAISLTLAAKVAEFGQFRLYRDASTNPIRFDKSHIMPFVSRMKLFFQNEKKFKERFENLLMNKLKDHHAISSRLR